MSALNENVINDIITAADATIPKVSPNFRVTLPEEIITLIKHKRKLRRKRIKDKSDEAKANYYRFCRLVKRKIQRFRSGGWCKFLEKVGSNPTSTKPFWKRINRFRRNPEANNVPTLREDGNIYRTDVQKANKFAEKLGLTFTDTPSPQFKQKHTSKVNDEVSSFLSLPATSIHTLQLNGLHASNKLENQHRR